MKYVVDRKKWYRGKGSRYSQLLRTDGMRCCIGFVGQQCGIGDRDLLGRLGAVNAPSTLWPKWFFVRHASSARDLILAYNLNDRRRMSDADREAALKALFAKHGDELEFVG